MLTSEAHWLQPRGEVPQEGSLVSKFQPTDCLPILPDFENNFHHIIDVTLRVHAARDGQPYKIHLCRSAKHQPPDFHRTNSAFQIQLGSQSHRGKLFRRNVRQKSPRIKINRMPARWLDDRYSVLGYVIAEIRR